jgi:FkbM family methyltransferase
MEVSPPNPDALQSSAYPSPLVELTFQGTSAAGPFRHVAKVPKAELFRVKSIFHEGEYKLARFSSGQARPKIILDIGANVGLFALYMKLNEPDAVIHCYEPVPSTLRLLVQNTRSLSGIHVHPYALGNRSGDVAIHLHRSNTGQNSLKQIDGERAYTTTTLVPCRSAGQELDDLNLDRIDVMKIDTEGCELDILESLGQRVERSDYVLLEFHSEADRRALDDYLKNFLLYSGKITAIGRGTLKYVHRRLITA